MIFVYQFDIITTMKRIILSMTEDQHKWLKELAEKKQITVSEMLRRLLDECRARQAKENDR